MKGNKLILIVFLVFMFLLIASPVFSQVGFRLGGGLSLPIYTSDEDLPDVPGIYVAVYDFGVYFQLKDYGLIGFDFQFIFFQDLPDIQIHLDYVHEFIFDNISYGIATSFGFNYIGHMVNQHGVGLKLGFQVAYAPEGLARIGVRAYASMTYGRDEGEGYFYLHFPIYIFLAL
jgi:hypothetical protein